MNDLVRLKGSHLLSYQHHKPSLGPSCFMASGAQIIGSVTCGAECSFWFNTVVRGDCYPITIGDRVNVQDGSIIHVTGGRFATHIGSHVSIGHNATIHGCTLGEGCLIGMGALVMDGVEIGANTLVAAGTLCPPGKTYPGGVLVRGNPGKVIRELKDEERALLAQTTQAYLRYKSEYKDGDG